MSRKPRFRPVRHDDVIVVDDFYGRPDIVRRLALRTDYVSETARQNFPGRESVKAFYCLEHVRAFERLVGAPVDIQPLQDVFGKFRLATSDSTRRTFVHTDKVDWTAVVYLSEQPHPRGLGIFRSREYGWDRVPDLGAMREAGYADDTDFDRRYVFPHSLDRGAWDEILCIPLRFNRLVLFRGRRCFHAALDLFGAGKESGRLSQHFFFNVPSPT
jgi:hypothetical protein